MLAVPFFIITKVLSIYQIHPLGCMCGSAIVSRHCIIVSAMSPERMRSYECSSDLLVYLSVKLQVGSEADVHDSGYFNLNVFREDMFNLRYLEYTYITMNIFKGTYYSSWISSLAEETTN